MWYTPQQRGIEGLEIHEGNTLATPTGRGNQYKLATRVKINK